MPSHLWFLLAAVVLVGCKPFTVQTPESETAPPPAPAVFMVRFGPDLLVPLGCVSDLGAPFETGRDCATLVPKGDSISVSDLGEVKSKGTFQARCEADGSGTAAVGILPLVAEPLSWPEAPAFAWWPMAAAGAPGAPKSFAPTSQQLQRLTELASQKAGDALGELMVRQAIELDLNGDGRAERIYSLTWGEELGGAWAWSALLLQAQGSDELRIIYESQHELFEVLAHVDLDRDGQREIWTRLIGGERESDQLESWDGDKVSVIGRWSCE
ncbi:MAG: hypothetical protein COW42_14170 [Deltaproteobacteria bacterium CG17_big_fil_post_rev_8_21_14_2_50_63_7]|nr:MAG: hypothetical protein COW42_14170 [Deltaproteobacteria bacterium CG17_big_fil_post_rev_8_21_14_2_50_63_7]